MALNYLQRLVQKPLYVKGYVPLYTYEGTIILNSVIVQGNVIHVFINTWLVKDVDPDPEDQYIIPYNKYCGKVVLWRLFNMQYLSSQHVLRVRKIGDVQGMVDIPQTYKILE
jgi:hypothetical protein